MNKLIAFMIAILPALAVAKGGDAKAGIEATNKAWMAGVEKHDAAAVAAQYTADAMLLPPGMETVTGAKNIKVFFDGLVGDGSVKKVDLTTSELFDGGDSATEIGKYTVVGASGQSLESGKYVVVWKKDGGKWKLHRDMWSSSAPPPKMAPASAPAAK
jgi:uncharacterized protein (TIGR02246 family)